MIAKKQYDENNHIIGISFGELSNINRETDIDDLNRVLSLLENMPKEVGSKTYLVEDEINGTISYDYKFENIPESELSADELKELFKDEIMNLISVETPPVQKSGYKLVPVWSGNTISWEYVIDGEAENFNDGTDYLYPITWKPGMRVSIGLWYTDGADVWEAIKDGVPTDFTDREYFDIIG